MIDLLRSIGGEEVCPYCFERYRIRDTPFRCTSPPNRCAPLVDPVLSKEWEDSRQTGRVLPSSGSFVRGLVCGTCGQRSQKRLCPQCHMELPHTTGDFRNYIFAIIGAKDTGKSHFIAVLVEQLRNQVGPDLDMLLEPLNEDTIRRYRDEFRDPIYRKHLSIPPTKSGVVMGSKVRIPLVFSLTFSAKNLFGQRKIVNAVTLVFFDTAGEDLNELDTMAVVNKYIYRSDGIILLLDPLQLTFVRDHLPPGTPLPSTNAETDEIITRTTQLIRRGRQMDLKAPVPTPIAIAFSKFDAVEPLLDPQLQILSAARHLGGFDKADFDAVSAEMQSLLASWGHQRILQQIDTNYAQFGYFGLSALGCNPHATGQIPRVVSRRVEDPFLWLLFKHGLLKAKRAAR